MTKLFAYLIILFILPPTPSSFGNGIMGECLEDYLNAHKAGIHNIVPPKSIAQELMDDTLKGEDIYGNEKLYNYLGNDLEKVKKKLSTWYYSGIKDRAKNYFDIVSELVGKQYTVLLVDPGIIGRAEDFIVFAKNYVELNGQVQPIILRKAYAEHLGTMRLYRGLMLTSDEAEYIAKNGILAPGMRDETVALDKISNIINEENQSGSPFNELKKRFFQKDENAVKSTNLYISTSRYKDLAASAGAHHSPTLDEKIKSLYVYEIEIPRISTLEVNQDTIFSSFKPSFRYGTEDYWIKAKRTMTIDNRDMGVEVFVPFHIQRDMIKKQEHFIKIPPEYKRGRADSEILKKVAQQLKTGSKEEKLEYIHGKFDVVDPDFKNQLIKWIEDKGTDYEIKKHALTFFLKKGNHDEIKALLTKLSPQEQQDLVLLWMIHPEYKSKAAHSISALADSMATNPQLQEIGRDLPDNNNRLALFDHPEVKALGPLVCPNNFDGKMYEAYLPKFKQIQDFYQKKYDPEVVSTHVAQKIASDKESPMFLRSSAAMAFINESTHADRYAKLELIKTLVKNNDNQLLTIIFNEESSFINYNSADIVSFLSRKPVLRRQVIEQTNGYGLAVQLTNSDWYLQPAKMELLINFIKKINKNPKDFYHLKELIEQMLDWLEHPDKYQKLSKEHITSAKEMLGIIRNKLSSFDPEQRKKIQLEIPGL